MERLKIKDNGTGAGDDTAVEAMRKHPIAKQHLQEMLNVLKAGRVLHRTFQSTPTTKLC